MPRDGAEVEPRKGKVRLLSLDDLDGRTTAAKRAREMVDAIREHRR